MGIRIKLFAVLKEIAGRSETILEAPKEISCEEVLFQLRNEIPNLASILESCLVAVNGRYADKNVYVSAEDEVAILPPVSGG